MNLIEKATTDGIICESKEMRDVINRVKMVGSTKAIVLITGETGVGKNVIAKFIHQNSPCKSGPFKMVNCGAFPEMLLESELFGHERGAFTDAHVTRDGLFKHADKGTLFLDEVGEMSPGLQVRCLNVLESQEFRRVGGKDEFKVDVRIIAATNMDLAEAVREKRFRIDLYYRLNVFRIHIPPLREHREDISALTDKFLTEFREAYGKENITGLSKEAKHYIQQVPWRGNVRQLRSAIDHAVICARGTELKLKDFPDLELDPLLAEPEPSDVAKPEPSDVAEPEPRESGAAAFRALMRFKTVSQANITDIYKPRNIERMMHTMGALIKGDVELGSLRRREMRSLGYAGDGTINNFFEHCKDLFFAEDRPEDRPQTATEFIEKLRCIYKNASKTRPQFREWEESSRKAITDQNANNIPLFRT